MSMTTNRLALRAVALCILLAASPLLHAETPDADALLASMQDALAPTTEHLARVRVSVKRTDSVQADKAWEALVVRKRFSDGPRTAVVMISPEDTAGMTMMTAPRGDGTGTGLWIYSPSERRTLQFGPLRIDQHFLETGFDLGDLAMHVRKMRDAQILDSEIIDGRLCWKVQAAPERDLYYSRIVTWIAQSSKLPLRREYFDRAERLWKVVRYEVTGADALETISSITLDDVQSGTRSEWQVQQLKNAGTEVSKEDFRPSALGDLGKRAFWPATSREVTSITGRVSGE